MAEGGEGEEAPVIALHESEAGAVEDADDAEGDEKRCDVVGLDREEADVEAEHGVEAELSGDDHGHGDWSFREGVGQPAVQRENGDLYGECKEEGESDPEECACG